jgi:hypothetical protein
MEMTAVELIEKLVPVDAATPHNELERVALSLCDLLATIELTK